MAFYDDVYSTEPKHLRCEEMERHELRFTYGDGGMYGLFWDGEKLLFGHMYDLDGDGVIGFPAGTIQIDPKQIPSIRRFLERLPPVHYKR